MHLPVRLAYGAWCFCWHQALFAGSPPPPALPGGSCTVAQPCQVPPRWCQPLLCSCHMPHPLAHALQVDSAIGLRASALDVLIDLCPPVNQGLDQPPHMVASQQPEALQGTLVACILQHQCKEVVLQAEGVRWDLLLQLRCNASPDADRIGSCPGCTISAETHHACTDSQACCCGW